MISAESSADLDREIQEKRISSHPDLVFDAPCVAGLRARTTSGPAPVEMSGIRSTPEGCVQHASSSGLRRNVFRFTAGRRIRSGMPIDAFRSSKIARLQRSDVKHSCDTLVCASGGTQNILGPATGQGDATVLRARMRSMCRTKVLNESLLQHGRLMQAAFLLAHP
jgi:hypothetical protein